MARHEDGSTHTLESDFEQVCQPAAPQVTQLWYKKVGNTTDILQRFKMDKCKLVETPIAFGTKLTKNDDEPTVNNTLYKQMVGILMYLNTTRLDVMYVVSIISIFMESPKDSHWKVGKKIMRYLASTLGYGHSFTR